MATDPVRDEADRLVAAAIAAVSMAARGLGVAGNRGRAGAGSSRAQQVDDSAGSRAEPAGALANGSPECCVCPVCRVIAAMRDPDPELAERLANGAGDLATGITGMLRAFFRPGGHAGVDPEASREGDEFFQALRRRVSATAPAEPADDDPWRAATTAMLPPRPMAKKAVAKKAVAKKAVAKKAVVEEAVAKKNVAKKNMAKKDVAKKNVANKNVAKTKKATKKATGKATIQAAKKAAPGAGQGA
jgi:hypothetical protein